MSSKKKMQVVYIGATWCKVCHTVKPAAVKLCHDFGVKFVELDFDEMEEDQKGSVSKLPTVRVMDGGVLKQEITTKHVDALREALATKPVVTTDDF
jgi:thiol-disulfide isomerase/thioredoxin